MVDTVTSIPSETTQETVNADAVKAAPTVSDAATSPTVFSAEKAASGGTLTKEGITNEVAKATTVLGDTDKPVEGDAPPVATVEAPKSTETAEVKETPKGEENKEGSQSAEPAPPPTYDTFVVPEGIQLDAERSTEFTKLLSELETEGKAEHALVQKFGQKAVDMYVADVQKTMTDFQKSQQDAWDRQKVQWKDEFLKDPVMGGENTKATIEAATSFLRTHGGTAEQQAEFRNLMETSGLGNHPVMIRLLANAGRVMREGQPLAASKPAPTTVKSKVATLYGSM